MNWIKKIFTKKAQEPEGHGVQLEVILEDSQGRAWMRYADMTQLPAQRAIAAEVALRQQEMNLSAESLDMLLEEMKKLGDQGKFSDVMTLVNEIQFRTQLVAEQETLMTLGTVYFLMEGEDPRTFDQEIQKHKRQAWKEDQGLADFFLQRAWELTISSSATLNSDIQTYLKTHEKDLERLNRFLPGISSIIS